MVLIAKKEEKCISSCVNIFAVRLRPDR
jgi:hypothetical protein